jgi:hypothetical protein
MMRASDVQTMGDLAAWLAERDLRLAPSISKPTGLHTVALVADGEIRSIKSCDDWLDALTAAMTDYDSE